MKGFLILLCVVAAAQARSTGIKVGGPTEAVRGQNPWLVHLRIAVSTSGLLESCAGSLIAGEWVLTGSDCVENARFIWLRYGAVDVIRPEVVTEASVALLHPEVDFALVSINRYVHPTANIRPVSIAQIGADLPSSANFCGWGATEDGAPGDILTCWGVTLEAQEDGSIVAQSEVAQATKYDIGAPLVVDGVQYGVLLKPGDESSAGSFLSIAEYRDWIEERTGISLDPGTEDEEDEEDDEGNDDDDENEDDEGGDDEAEDDEDDEAEDEDASKVNFVN